jgi:hypothetical protein
MHPIDQGACFNFSNHIINLKPQQFVIWFGSSQDLVVFGIICTFLMSKDELKCENLIISARFMVSELILMT